MAERTWETRELPILEAIVAAVDAGEDPTRPARTAVPGLPAEVYGAVIQNLNDSGYLDAALTKGSGGGLFGVDVRGIRSRGRVATGQWPGADVAADLLATLDAEIERTNDEEKKGRLRRVASACAELGKDLLTETLAKVIVHSAGG